MIETSFFWETESTLIKVQWLISAIIFGKLGWQVPSSTARETNISQLFLSQVAEDWDTKMGLQAPTPSRSDLPTEQEHLHLLEAQLYRQYGTWTGLGGTNSGISAPTVQSPQQLENFQHPCCTLVQGRNHNNQSASKLSKRLDNPGCRLIIVIIPLYKDAI